MVPVSIPHLILIAGPETLLIDRGVDRIVGAARQESPDVEVIRMHGATYTEGELMLQASPSLFGGEKLLLVRDLDEATDELILDLEHYLKSPDLAVRLIVTHKGGQRGKRILDALKKAQAHVIEAKAIKNAGEKAAFVTSEFRTAGRRVRPEAVQALVEAVGADLRELASACQQLISDTQGDIDLDLVTTYHAGKVEATGFRVADAAIAGNAAEALRLLRHALAVGENPVPIVALLASQLRQLVKVEAAGRGRKEDIARQVGLAPWQVEKAWRALNGWSSEGLGRSIQAVAAADFEVKGGGRDPEYAVERAVLTITRERRGR
ncbi:MAG: DNA polymerase III subunit delta [Actinomycetia bacterium]|nr:DNA polymerase III subunit delta [Actinomycetes bacterium]